MDTAIVILTLAFRPTPAPAPLERVASLTLPKATQIQTRAPEKVKPCNIWEVRE